MVLASVLYLEKGLGYLLPCTVASMNCVGDYLNRKCDHQLFFPYVDSVES